MKGGAPVSSFWSTGKGHKKDMRMGCRERILFVGFLGQGLSGEIWECARNPSALSQKLPERPNALCQSGAYGPDFPAGPFPDRGMGALQAGPL